MSSHFGNRFYLITIALLLTLITVSLAQNAPPSTEPGSQMPSDSENSLAAAARRSKAQKNARAKKVITDDDVHPSIGPLPRLRMDGAENSDEIIAAIAKYKEKHSPEQVEEAVRQWYDFYDDQLEAAIRENINIRALRAANVSNGYDLCQESRDYRKCETRRQAEIKGARHDQVEINSNNNVIVRLQHALMNVRNGFMQNGISYKWFKIRTTNNIDRF